MLKKSLLTIFALFFAIFTYSQSYVQIGNGTVSGTLPFYSAWNYSWSSLIYKQSDIGGAKSITKIAFFSTNAKTMTNQKIYMKLTSDNVFGTANYENPTANGYTLVFDGTLTTTANAWVEIPLIAPFAYDGVKNIIIHGENRWGQAYGANFNSTTSTVNNNKSSGNDLSFPTTQGYLNPYPSAIPNIRFYYTSNDPVTPGEETPVSSAVKVNGNPILKFKLGTNTTAYDLFFGSDKTKVETGDASVKVVPDASVSAPGFFEFVVSSLLGSKTKYYWKVVAKNNSTSTSSPLWDFTVQRIISTFPYNQKFNYVADGDNVFYKGWYGMFTDWTFPTKNNAGGSITTWGGNEEIPSVAPNPPCKDSIAYIASDYLDAGSYSLQSPRFNLSGNGGKYKISFEWRNDNAVANTQHKTHFEISKDGGVNWTELAVLSAGEALQVMKLETIDLAGYGTDNVYFRWRYEKLGTDADYVYLDNISVTENNGQSEISLDKTSYTFGEICIKGKTKYDLKISNPSTSPLVITGVQKEGDFNCSATFPVTIAAGGSSTLPIEFIPQTVGNLTGKLTFNVQGTFSGDNVINLTGNCINAIKTYYESFDAVANTTIPAGWNRIFNASDVNIWCYVKSSTYNLDYVSPSSAFLLYNNQGLASAKAPALMAILPGVTDFNTNKLTFKAKHSTSFTPLEIGVTDDPYNASAFVSVTSIQLSPNFAEYTVDFNSLIPGNTKPYIVFRHPQLEIMRKIFIDDVQWDNPASNLPPSPAVIVSPKTDAVNLPNMMQITLKWASGGGNPIGYYLYLGKTSDAKDVVNGLDMGTVTSKTFTNLEFNTEYYWKVVPYNEFGETTNIPVWKFKTQEYPVVTTFPYIEGFENCNDSLSAQSSRFPLGWSLENGNDNFTWTYIKNGSFNNANTGNYAMHAFSTSNSLGMNDLLFTRPIKMRKGYKYEVEFYYKTAVLMDPNTVEKLQVGYGKDNTSAAITKIIWDQTLDNRTYSKGTTLITPTEDADYYISFICLSSGNQGLLLLDDVTVRELEPGHEAGLSDLKVGSATVVGFNSSSLNYKIELPYGTTNIPVVSATATDAKAVINITNATKLNGTTTERTTSIKVTAEDGTTEKNYTIEFSVAKNSAAEMISFTMPNQVGVTTMNTTTHTITINLPAGSSTTQVATFSVSPGAIVSIGGVAQVSGATSNSFVSPVVYKIMSENGANSVEWTVTVNIATGIADMNAELNNINIFPNPSNGLFTIHIPELKGESTLIIMNNIGQPVYSQIIRSEKETINAEDLKSGIYFIKVISDKKEYNGKLIIR